MTFEEVLAQIIDVLKRQGRVSYGALKRRYDLDDAYLEDLKDEIIKAQRLATDEDGRILVWAGDPEGTSVSTTQTVQPPPSSPTQQDLPTSVDSRTPEAERRQLTVMFCDLVDSTKLSSHLDPEDYREVVRAYQATCTEVIHRYDGYIAQYLGDGLLVYFGYPQNHEDEAQRAVYTGLGILNTLKQLNVRLEQEKGIRLALRIGIHTGVVVVGDIGAGSRQEQLALGETPNVAARIQGLAEPDMVIISDATYRLIQGYFEFQELGERVFRGVTQPLPVYQVLQESGVQSRLDVASTRGLTPLVGREQEVGLLIERWEQAKTRQGQVILLSGEAGIGKSRLVQVLKDHVAEERHTRWECRSSPYYQNTALYPLIDLLQRALQWHQDDAPEQRLEKLEYLLSQYRLPLEETVPLFASLLSLLVPEERYSPLELSSQRQRQKTLETIVALLLELAERETVLFILEDLHWTDPTTLEFLTLLVEQVPAAAICTLLTCRPEFQPSWSHRSYLTEMTVHRLSRLQIERMAEQVAGEKRLPDEIVQQLIEKTDGVPLYVEEMTKAVLESGVVKKMNGQYELIGSVASLAIPATLQDSLMTRLDRLVTAKAVAQYASVIGRQFSYELLQAVTELDEATLQRELGRLVSTELVYQRGLPPNATYMFKHALIQDIAYDSLLRSTRQGYHRRIAEVLEERFPDIVTEQPELVAHHYTAAGMNEQAIGYWQQAGQEAVQRSAHQEAIAHLTKGLALLPILPDTSHRAQQELTLHIALGPSLIATRGYAAPEVEQTYNRAQELCQTVGETPQLFQTLYGLFYFHLIRAEFPLALEWAEQLLRLAQRQQDPSLLLVAYQALPGALFHLGELTRTRAYLEQGLALYDPQQHHALAFRYGLDLEVFFLAYAARPLWLLGFPDQARTRLRKALALAQTLGHPFSLAFALHWTSTIHQLCRQAPAVQEQAEASVAFSGEQGFAIWVPGGTMLRGWARTEQGEVEEGITQMRRGITAWQATGAKADLPYFLALLVEGYRIAGQTEDGLHVLAEALALMDTIGERYYEAELYRLKGQLLLLQASPDEHTVETFFNQALDTACSQQAKSLELRTATSLAKLWQRQGKRQDAYDLLAPVYNWFTEGFDTADLKDAKALLHELGE